MPNVRQPSKPDADISDYEWSMTPPSVKFLISQWRELLGKKQQQINNAKAENQWLREQLNLRLEQSHRLAPPLLPEIILWGMVGLILTIGGTFIEASTLSVPWLWGQDGISTQSLGVTYQIGAVLVTGCLGGGSAALLSQVVYLALGLFGLPIFDRGGGWEYMLEPHFGYLLGFLVGAWLCGYLAFKKSVKIDRLIFSCFAGLLSIHLVGVVYFVILYIFRGASLGLDSLAQGIYVYSIAPLPGQIAVSCVVVAIAYLMRKIMFT